MFFDLRSRAYWPTAPPFPRTLPWRLISSLIISTTKGGRSVSQGRTADHTGSSPGCGTWDGLGLRVGEIPCPVMMSTLSDSSANSLYTRIVPLVGNKSPNLRVGVKWSYCGLTDRHNLEFRLVKSIRKPCGRRDVAYCSPGCKPMNLSLREVGCPTDHIAPLLFMVGFRSPRSALEANTVGGSAPLG